MLHLAIHRNPAYFPSPSVFCPERWIVEEKAGSRDTWASKLSIPRTEDAVRTAQKAFIPFSRGARNCAGKTLARHELLAALACLVYKFDMRLARDPRSGGPLKNTMDWRKDVSGAKDLEYEREYGREERRRPDDFQTKDWFTVDRNGPMMEFKLAI